MTNRPTIFLRAVFAVLFAFTPVAVIPLSAEGAPGETPILEEPYQITIGGSTQSSSLVITLNGRNQPRPVVPPGRTPAGQTP